jgi:hypothetical protein
VSAPVYPLELVLAVEARMKAMQAANLAAQMAAWKATINSPHMCRVRGELRAAADRAAKRAIKRAMRRQIRREYVAKSTAGLGPKGKAKVATVMSEWGKDKLRSGSKKGPVVSSQKQAVAIALSQARQASRAGKK